MVDGPRSCDAIQSLRTFTARRRLPYGSYSLSNYVGGCSVSDQAITTRGSSLCRWRAFCSLHAIARTYLRSSGRVKTLRRFPSMPLLIHLLHDRSLISAPSVLFLENGRKPRWPHKYYHELTNTIPAIAHEPELTTLDSIDIERLERWTLKPQTNWCGSRRVNYTRRQLFAYDKCKINTISPIIWALLQHDKRTCNASGRVCL